MDMYSSASREALNTKGRLEIYMSAEIVDDEFEEVRSAEAAVLAVLKMEKAKCRATMESSVKAQIMAELEGSKQK
ncbi:hypothetical protein DY000_02032771 [Brassica cretica]|uniref:Uncharacterized protein n=1 Tax=Brassica cretica TaxID=69181 RepID=A0ABQ7DSQ4_BRACR|nr:hypothetical protein DY000_02032771 [Brassica cretica]